ncbi:DUF397 domain-containing protein [Streptomyces sp. NPDC002328]|uniref:DUF397 domain-containing protein n=1 Tax=Streptomyces sp. NPDC002328 TaxID=3364642 RepID=UPI003679FF79
MFCASFRTTARMDSMPLPLTGWHKSSYSTDFEDACVEASVDGPDRGVRIRDTKDRGLRPLTASGQAWRAFLRTLRTDQVTGHRHRRSVSRAA